MKTATDRGLFIRIISALVSKDTDSLRVSAGQIRSNEAEHTIAEYLWVQLKTLDKLGVCSISPNGRKTLETPNLGQLQWNLFTSIFGGRYMVIYFEGYLILEASEADLISSTYTTWTGSKSPKIYEFDSINLLGCLQ